MVLEDLGFERRCLMQNQSQSILGQIYWVEKLGFGQIEFEILGFEAIILEVALSRARVTIGVLKKKLDLLNIDLGKGLQVQFGDYNF